MTTEEALAALDRATEWLTRVETPEEARKVGDVAEAIRLLADRQQLGLKAQNRGAQVRLHADRRFVELAAPRLQRGGDPALREKTLADYRVSYSEWDRLKALVGWAPDQLDAWVEAQTREGKEITRGFAVSEARAFAAGYAAGRDSARPRLNGLLARYQAATGNPDADERDLFQTPPWALDCILEYLPRNARIWECAAGTGNLVGRLRYLGFTVLATDICPAEPSSTPLDFLKEPADPASFDLILTNPPYSYKDQFLARCFEIGRPFLLLMPVTAIAEQGRMAMYHRWGIDLVLPPRRINFETPSGLSDGNGSSAWKFTGWFCHGLSIPQEHFGGRVVFPPTGADGSAPLTLDERRLLREVAELGERP